MDPKSTALGTVIGFPLGMLAGVAIPRAAAEPAVPEIVSTIISKIAIKMTKFEPPFNLAATLLRVSKGMVPGDFYLYGWTDAYGDVFAYTKIYQDPNTGKWAVEILNHHGAEMEITVGALRWLKPGWEAQTKFFLYFLQTPDGQNFEIAGSWD